MGGIPILPSEPNDATGSLPVFAAALEKLGVRADLEADGAMVVLRPPDAAALAEMRDDRVRARVMDAVRAAGFTHAAVELPDTPAPNEERADGGIRPA